MPALPVRAAEPATRPAAPIIALRGDAPALGEAHAKALGDALQAIPGFLDKAIGADMRPLATRGAMMFESTLRPEHLAEIRALATSSKIPEADIMLANSFLDLSPMEACSSISVPADASPDHVARFARNLDFPTYGIADKSSVVFVYQPTDRFGFVSISWPGLIGVLSGMNEHGLALTNMEVTRPAGSVPKAMPYTLLYRTVLERCKTVDEAIDLLKTTPRQTPNNLMLMDASGNRAVVELTPEKVVVRTGKPGAALISTNHQRGEDQDTPGRCDRYDYLHDTALKDFGKLDREKLQAMLSHVQQDQMTIQSMIFEPGNRVIYLSTGMNAADGEMKKIDLGDYFK